MPRERVTERTFYPVLMDIIGEAGGTGVQEVSYNSVPDIVFQLNSHRWILSVKIGQDLGTIKGAFIQYLRHKEESNIPFGILLLLPQSIRAVRATEEEVQAAIRREIPAALIDAGPVKEEIRDRPFPGIIDFLQTVILTRLARREHTYYPLSRVISLLQQQVSEMMSEITLDESSILRIVTDRSLLMDLGHLKANQVEGVARFLASYILMSQILFLRLLASARPNLFPGRLSPVSHHKLRSAFAKVLEINYRPIYAVDVLDAIPDRFLKDTFDLIWGLEIERVRHELPGRIFHELMPSKIRKMLAAFYTRPQAADILAHLSFERSGETVFDPACGSGTILVSAYRRKNELFQKEGKAGNPHKRFSEEEIFGADIMPFAVHLASANLAAMDVATPIDRTQIIQSDSLELAAGKDYTEGLQLGMFQEAPTARTMGGDVYKVPLDKVDVILMNPPFTKVERGIRDFVDMERFKNRVGGEVGLWGHFIALADHFLEDGGAFGAVIPINVLRGRESEKVRRIIFEEWTPLYILKPTRNYGFSEWAEYRDILFIARKQKSEPDHQVKFCLVKKDLTRLTEEDVATIVEKVRMQTKSREDDLVDIDSHKCSEVNKRFNNMMWFCSGVSLAYRDQLVDFITKFTTHLNKIPGGYFREGYRSEGGIADALYLNRGVRKSGRGKSFLEFDTEGEKIIKVESPLTAEYEIEREAVMPSLRSGVGLSTMNVTDSCDYIAYKKYKEFERVRRASGIKKMSGEESRRLWEKLWHETSYASNLVVTTRINPFSPSVNLFAFYSDSLLLPSNQFKTVRLPDLTSAKAVCTLFNSVVFLAQFMILKEESTGRFVHFQATDFQEVALIPNGEKRLALADLFDKYGEAKFPPLRNQFDASFDERYDEFWERERGQSVQQRLWSFLDQPIQPSRQRLNLDLAVCQALGVPISANELIQLYEVFVNEMIMIRGLTRD